MGITPKADAVCLAMLQGGWDTAWSCSQPLFVGTALACNLDAASATRHKNLQVQAGTMIPADLNTVPATLQVWPGTAARAHAYAKGGLPAAAGRQGCCGAPGVR